MNGDAHIVTVTGYASGGEGVARLDDGRVAFVRGAARGDICQLKIVNEQKRSCRAEISRIVEPSQHRMEPDCPVYPICGGCDFRHINYAEELWAKQKRVNDALERIGGISARAVEMLSTGQVDGYRNKAVFHIALQNETPVIGFYRHGTHDVCPVSRCLLLRDELNAALHKLWNAPPQKDSSVTLRAGQSVSETSVEVELDGLVFQISAASFFQVNSDAAVLLYSKAREYAALSAKEILVDLYCGVGSLTMFIGRDAGYALGVESNSSAVDDARGNAQRNGLRHIDFICADAADWDISSIRPDCVIVDPPRRGLSAGAVQKILEMSPARIVYISCDPATLARDIMRLRGYEAQDVCAVDMFPRTANVESCALLCRK